MYKQLTLEQRYQIVYGLQHKHSYRQIARTIGCSATTVYNEIKRNSNSATGVYTARGANRKCRLKHRDKPKKTKITSEIWSIIHHYLKKKFSPEQICNTVKEIQALNISPKAIYAYIKRHFSYGHNVYKHLRRQGKKYHKRLNPAGKIISRIPHRISIHERPKSVETKEELGHWEADTIQGKGRFTAILTLVERKTGFTLMAKLNGKNAQDLAKKGINVMWNYRDKVKTITFDNGVEFFAHKMMADALECETYFADPHSPWQRGLNENTNGLIRQYFPKGMDLRSVTQEELNKVERELNSRPRKSRGYHSPSELF